MTYWVGCSVGRVVAEEGSKTSSARSREDRVERRLVRAQAQQEQAVVLAVLLPLVASFLKNGGLNKILSGLQQQGKGSQAASWVGTGDNEAVSGADLEQVIGSDQISAIAEQLGISNEQAADAVAEVLPQVVDRVSPEGELPAETDLDDLFAQLAGRSAN